MQPSGGGIDEVVVRRARPDELDAVVELCGRALGWTPGEPNEALFRWKHRDSPFGPSPTWVAEEDGRLVAVRAFLRWAFRRPDGTVVQAVRAVDTATDPEHQGRGLFTRLTTGALPELVDDGIGFVFNTPNDQSRPGYLKMGWEVVGRVPVGVALGRPRGALRLAGARTAAGKWSLPTTAGRPAAEVLADRASIAELLGAAGPPAGLATDRSPEVLWWRYAAGPVRYRAVQLGRSAVDGLAVFRLRRRGGAVEATVAELLVPDGPDAGDRRARLVGAVRRVARPDHLLATVRHRREGPLVRVDRLGPVLTWRALADEHRPDLPAWDLHLGDVELF